MKLGQFESNQKEYLSQDVLRLDIVIFRCAYFPIYAFERLFLTRSLFLLSIDTQDVPVPNWDDDILITNSVVIPSMQTILR
jgi:hypothetical protein